MEFSSFQFLSHEEDDFSNFYSSQEMGDPKVNGDDVKQRRTDFAADGGAEAFISTFNMSVGEDQWVDYQTGFQQHFTSFDDVVMSTMSKGSRCPGVNNNGFDDAFGMEAAAAAEEGRTIKTSGRQRRLWVKTRSKDWWERYNHPDISEVEFRRAFRMSKATFDMICKELESSLIKKSTTLREAIPVRQRVAVCIWRLAHGEPLRLISKRFGLGISTCHKLALEVCSAIRTVLMPRFIKWPVEAKMRQIKGEFESISGISNVGGSIYTTHISIIAPKSNKSAYFNKRHTKRNQKTSYSITVQGVVDMNLIFTDVSIGWPGSMSDDQVLEKTTLFDQANKGLLKDVWIVGNSGHPLMDWLLVPYNLQHLTRTQHEFNERTLIIQGVAKEAFARLKKRWACLQKRTEIKLQDLPVVLGACCVLHNICEMMNEEMEGRSDYELSDDAMVAQNSVRSLSSVQARDQIAHNLLHRGFAWTSFLSS